VSCQSQLCNSTAQAEVSADLFPPKDRRGTWLKPVILLIHKRTGPGSLAGLRREAALLRKTLLQGPSAPPEVPGTPAIRPSNSCVHKLPAQAETGAQAAYTGLRGTYRVLVMVNALCQDRAE